MVGSRPVLSLPVFSVVVVDSKPEFGLVRVLTDKNRGLKKMIQDSVTGRTRN